MPREHVRGVGGRGQDTRNGGRCTQSAGGVGRRTVLGLVGASAVSLAGCSGGDNGGTTTDANGSEETTGGTGGGTATDETAGKETVMTTGGERGDPPTGYTYQRPTGNRVVGGRGRLPGADPVDVGIEWTPAWVVGVPGPGNADGSGAGGSDDATGSTWAIVGENGEVVGVRVADGEASTAEASPGELPAGMPPTLRGGRPPTLLAPPASADDRARPTHPVPVEDGLLYVSADGDLVLWNDGEIDRLALDVLPDARIVTADGRAFAFADATERYDHAVLGDGVEAGRVAVADHRGGLSEEALIQPEPAGSAVFEGIAPIVADPTGDGDRNVVVTESDAERGARVVAFDGGGTRLATGPAIGHGYGWRHQLAVAPFGPDGTVEIGAVRTPHVGKTAEFYRLDGEDLRIVAEASGYSSHAMGSRNLDAGLAGDLDGDGTVELLVPTADQRALGGVRRTEGGAAGVWEVSLGGELTTNLGAVNAGGRVTVAAGWDGNVRFWPG